MASANYEPSQASTNYKEAFSLFDKRGNGRVALDSLGDLLRACGQNPTLSEIRDLEKNVGGDCECALYPIRSCDAFPCPSSFPSVARSRHTRNWGGRRPRHCPSLSTKTRRQRGA